MAAGQGLAAQSGKIECGSFIGKIQSIDGPASMPDGEGNVLTVERMPQAFSFTASAGIEDGTFDVLKEAYNRYVEYAPITVMFRPGPQWFMPEIKLIDGEIQSIELDDMFCTLNLRASRKQVAFDHWFAAPVFWAWTVWRKIQKWISR